MGRYTEQELRDLYFDTLDFFNDALDSGITRDNTVLAFFIPDNGLEVYEQFCQKYFPKNLDENYTADGYFQSFAAQAFVGEGRYGVIIRSDLDLRLAELRCIFSTKYPICSAVRMRSRTAAFSTATVWATEPRTA